MNECAFTKEIIEQNNIDFEREVHQILSEWVERYKDRLLLQFDQPLKEYLENDALRDFFLNTSQPMQILLSNPRIANHLGRCAVQVYFDPESGDPLLAPTEQRIYNLARRMDSERMHVPFRSVYTNKQTDAGNTADVSTYPAGSEEIRYNSGNHFISRPANNNVFDQHSRLCLDKAGGNLHIIFKRGFLEDRLQEVKEHTALLNSSGETQPQFFVIYSRHSPQEGHFGVSLVVMEPANPYFPKRVLVCDTLLKELPQHPRWWNHFIAEYSNVFGSGVAEIIEDLSHPLQKVNIKGDNPYRHDWDCPYYAASMANALADLVNNDAELILNSTAGDIHQAMKHLMPDYYQADLTIMNRDNIRLVNRLKRWDSGKELINDLVANITCNLYYEV